MKFYCLCKITGDVPKRAKDSQGFGPLDKQVYLAPNRYGVLDADDDFRPVIVERSMECVKNGVHQKVLNKSCANQWPKSKDEGIRDFHLLKSARRHYPNVDLYRCRHCGAEIIVEG